MKNITILLIALMVISAGLLSGCTQESKSPTASASANPTSGSAPLSVSFTGSGTDPDGNIESYLWDFSDGQTSIVQSPYHTFQNTGTYTVTLTVTDNNGATGTDSIVITVLTSSYPPQPPTASASASPISGETPLTVTFTGVGSDADGSIGSYRWSFGDGSTSTLQNPSHTFTDAGTYSVVLTVTDDDGATGTDTLTIFVTEINQPPTVSPTASPSSGVVPLEVHFTGSASDSDGSIASYQWDFKDGQTSSQKNPTHTFQVAGSYSVKFTATDNKGASAYDYVIITVLEDTDRDGIADIDDPDDDNDGYLDYEDYLPKQDAKIKILLKEFRVIDEVDPSPENSDAEIFFQIDINDIYQAHVPPNPTDNYWKVTIGELKTINEFYIYDCDDDEKDYKINIQMWDYDGGIWSELVDIDGHDTSKGITINYDIVSGVWTGDDNDGITDGSDDGTQQSDDNDAYLEYDITTV